LWRGHEIEERVWNGACFHGVAFCGNISRSMGYCFAACCICRGNSVCGRSELGEEVAVRAVPWKRAIAYLDGGKGGLGGIYKTKPRLEKYDYTDEIFSEEIMVYVPKGKAFAFSSVYDLAGKRLGVIRGWSYGEEFDEAREKGRLSSPSPKKVFQIKLRFWSRR